MLLKEVDNDTRDPIIKTTWTPSNDPWAKKPPALKESYLAILSRYWRSLSLIMQ